MSLLGAAKSFSKAKSILKSIFKAFFKLLGLIRISKKRVIREFNILRSKETIRRKGLLSFVCSIFLRFQTALLRSKSQMADWKPKPAKLFPVV